MLSNNFVNSRAIDLTEALLVLSRSDQRSFTRERVDLSLIAEEASETLLPLALELQHNRHMPLLGVIRRLTLAPAAILELPGGTQVLMSRGDIFAGLAELNPALIRTAVLLEARIDHHGVCSDRWAHEKTRTSEDETEDAPLLPEHMLRVPIAQDVI